MVSVRQERRRVLGALVLAALLFVPVIASGHYHAGHVAAPCAACAVTRHTPVVSASVAMVVVSLPIVVGVEPLAARAPLAPSVRDATSRGPPARLLPQEA
jgi:hypothetical protein